MPKHEVIRRPLADVLASLPERCYARNPVDKLPIEIERGRAGYRYASVIDPERANAANHVSPAQAEAMLAGSMFGFDVPGADPLNYPQLPATFTSNVGETFTSEDRRRTSRYREGG